jgi:predicted  nucleic acid-binding Zn-ribbon protein
MIDDKTLDKMVRKLKDIVKCESCRNHVPVEHIEAAITAIAALRDRIATLEKEQTELDKVRYDEIMALREQNGALSERIAALESMLRVCRSAFEQRGLMTYVWEIDSTTARAALKEGK